MSKKVLIVGGVAGGASAAARLRRLDEEAEIILFEKGSYISFANCGLPYYIGNVIEERQKLLLQTPEAMKKRFNIDVRINNEVVTINKENKKVTVKNIDKNITYEETYDELVLSTGSSPLKPPIPGIDTHNIFTIWNIPDTDAIKNYIDQNNIQNVAIIGGGFIGIEMAENLKDLGLDVSIIEMANQVMAPLDFEMAQFVHKHMEEKGIQLILGDGVKEFITKENITTVFTGQGKAIPAEMVILSIGVKPNSQLAEASGLALNNRGGIIVDEHLKTSDPYIWAVGDVIQVKDYVNDVDTMIPLAGPANKQGRMVANNICGANEIYKGTQGTSVAKVFDFTVSTTGSNEKTLQRFGKVYGKDYLCIHLHPLSHAGYYPGGKVIHLKLIFRPIDGKVLGVQGIGGDGTEKRIDVIAAAMRFGATVEDLKELELAYAPPYSSAKDPVNMAGFTASNILSGDMDIIQYHEVPTLDLNENVLLDLRTPAEITMGYIPHSVNITIDDLRNNLHQLDKEKTIIVYCAVGVRAWIGVSILRNHGYNVKNLTGGFTTYYNAYYNAPDKIAYPDDNNSDDKEVESKQKEMIKIDACGLQCPGPIMQVYNAIQSIDKGDIIEVKATDMGFCADIEGWCRRTNNTLLKSETEDHVTTVCIMKGSDNNDVSHATALCSSNTMPQYNDKTMIVFSGDLDKALASFIIANGAASMGRKVTMFFTFWGLNVLRKEENVQVNKSLIEKMFGFMMPQGSKKLKLSKMNMGGMGTKMMRMVMQNKNVSSLEDLIKLALHNGVEMIACTMSMDVMGITKEELIQGVKFAGVANYLAAAEESDVNLFI
ncbi:MAG: FAD-dependent oxidoreductase [Eubacteriales bacterium]